MTENIKHTLATDQAQAILFGKSNVTETYIDEVVKEKGVVKINGEELDRIARNPQQFHFIVLTCNYTLKFCAEVITETKLFIRKEFGNQIDLYYMDSTQNQVFMRDSIINPNLNGKLAVYYKSADNLFTGGKPKYGDMSLDGLISYEELDGY